MSDDWVTLTEEADEAAWKAKLAFAAGDFPNYWIKTGAEAQERIQSEYERVKDVTPSEALYTRSHVIATQIAGLTPDHIVRVIYMALTFHGQPELLEKAFTELLKEGAPEDGGHNPGDSGASS